MHVITYYGLLTHAFVGTCLCFVGKIPADDKKT